MNGPILSLSFQYKQEMYNKSPPAYQMIIPWNGRPDARCLESQKYVTLHKADKDLIAVILLISEIYRVKTSTIVLF